MANRDEMSFGRAFADARREMGGGKIFTWRGNKYTTDLAEEAPRRRTGPATENAPTESMRPRPRSSITENIPSRLESRNREFSRKRSMGTFNEDGTVQGEGQAARPGPRSAPRTQSAPERRMGTFSEKGTVEGEGQRARPGSLQRLINQAPDAASRTKADRIAEQVQAGRMPLRQALNTIRDLFSSFTSPMAGRNEELRQRRAAAGMARGGMVKKGNTDRRGKGMFYDSKSPRGYK